MPTRPDLRELTTGVRDAFADADRETLLDVLSFVVKEYVVDGPPPMMIHQVETLGDLANLSFAQLIAALQTRFEHPELAMFTVDGDHVSVRVGGVMQPLVAARQVPGAAVIAPVAAELPRPAAGVRVVEATLSQGRPVLAPPSAASPSPSAPRPISGMSLQGRPSDGGVRAPAAAAPPPTAAAVPAPAAPPADAKPDKPGNSGDDSSARFSLLELD